MDLDILLLITGVGDDERRTFLKLIKYVVMWCHHSSYIPYVIVIYDKRPSVPNKITGKGKDKKDAPY